ncbi:hypothetical protein [Streptomyces thioluteus]|uniref:hypothetical protein n=1 Tax=Streptomyces thioluteus TaxID=66431 RepID=UPI0031EEFF8E
MGDQRPGRRLEPQRAVRTVEFLRPVQRADGLLGPAEREPQLAEYAGGPGPWTTRVAAPVARSTARAA